MSDLLKLNNIVQRSGDIKAFPLSSNMKSSKHGKGLWGEVTIAIDSESVECLWSNDAIGILYIFGRDEWRKESEGEEGAMMIEINKIYNMDCFDFLKEVKTGSVDLVLIDPPYGVSRDTNFAKGYKKGTDVDRFRVSMDFGEWDKDFTGLDMVIKECYRILRKGGTLICFYDLWKITNLKDFFEQGKFKQIRFIEWLKTNPVPINSNINYLTNSREIALLGIKDSKPTFNSKYDNGVYEYPDDEIYQNPDHGIYRYPICHDKGRFHPTQKPVKLIEELILKHSDESDIVLDCFMGSGTTAIACINTNRQFLGCELDPTYYANAEERIKKAKLDKLLEVQDTTDYNEKADIEKGGN